MLSVRNIQMLTFMHPEVLKQGQDCTEWVSQNIMTKCRKTFIYMDKLETIFRVQAWC